MKAFAIDYTQQVSNHVMIHAESEEEAIEIFDGGKWVPEVGDDIDNRKITEITEEVGDVDIDPSAGLPVVPLVKNSKTPLLN